MYNPSRCMRATVQNLISTLVYLYVSILYNRN
jgi:hypothetical protein